MKNRSAPCIRYKMLQVQIFYSSSLFLNSMETLLSQRKLLQVIITRCVSSAWLLFTCVLTSMNHTSACYELPVIFGFLQSLISLGQALQWGQKGKKNRRAGKIVAAMVLLIFKQGCALRKIEGSPVL